MKNKPNPNKNKARGKNRPQAPKGKPSATAAAAKPAASTPTPKAVAQETSPNVSMPFGKKNYFLMLLGLLTIAIGFTAMSLETAEYGFGPLGLYVGPIVVLIGFVIEVFAILHNPNATATNPKQD